MTQLTGGSNYDIHFQQNLNHFYKENPGRLVADFATTADPEEADFTPLGEPIPDYNAMNMITQTNFTMSVVVPNVECEHCVVRLRYLSNNPTEDHGGGMIFYQCADVSVSKLDSGANIIESSPSTPIVVKPADAQEEGGRNLSCCAAKQFTMEGSETASWRNPTHKHYYIDGVNQLLRVDTDSGEGITTKDGAFQMYNNFTSGIEYYFNVHADTCDLYGLNLWSDWCYGEANAQAPISVINIAGQTADVWSMKEPESPFTWTNARHGCIPVGMSRVDTSENTVFYNYQVGAPPSDFFDLPQACLDAESSRLQSGKPLEPSPQEHSIDRHRAVRM